jgi:hypothetical protein
MKKERGLPPALDCHLFAVEVIPTDKPLSFIKDRTGWES